MARFTDKEKEMHKKLTEQFDKLPEALKFQAFGYVQGLAYATTANGKAKQ